MKERLASSLGRNDEHPNIELAEEIVRRKDTAGLAQVVALLRDKNQALAGDAIKVIYEVAERDASLVAGYAPDFIGLLQSKNNRLVWGAMYALARIAPLKPEIIFAHLDEVLAAYEKGSVITVDAAVSVFACVARADAGYEERLFPLIISHLEKCRAKEIAQHAERAFVCVAGHNKEAFVDVLERRSGELSETQRKRVNKLLKLIREERYAQ